MAHEIRCARCGMALVIADGFATDQLACPRCLAGIPSSAREPSSPLPAGTGPRPGRSAGQDVSRDTNIMHGCLSVLTILCIVGIIGVYVHAKGVKENLDAMLWLAVLFFVLDIAILLQIFRWIFQPQSRESVLQGEGYFTLLASVVLFMALAAAVVIFFFFACAGLLDTM